MSSSGTYFIYDRLRYLEDADTFISKWYMQKWEVSKRTFHRDLEHLKLFRGIEFEYDRNAKVYRRKKDL